MTPKQLQQHTALDVCYFYLNSTADLCLQQENIHGWDFNLINRVLPKTVQFKLPVTYCCLQEEDHYGLFRILHQIISILTLVISTN